MVPSAPAAHAPRPGLRDGLRDAPATLALVAVNLAVFAWGWAHGATEDQAVLVRLGALERSHVWAGEAWRLVAAAFIHVGWFHLACNIVFGMGVCAVVERALGHWRTVAVYLASAIAASSLSLLGQDGIAAGASGALFGMVGVLLALHRRAAGSWRAFARSRATHWLAAGIVTTALAGVVLPLDHLAHLGGLVAGVALGAILSSPPPRRAAVALFAAALGGLAALAAWPRSAPSRLERAELEERLHAALGARETAAARQLLERADARRMTSERLGYYRALLAVQEGDLEAALVAARPLLAAGEPALRDEGGRLVRGVARALAYRAYTGEGAPRNPWRALSLMEEACRAGDAQGCRDAERIRGPPPP
jgi:membrane associated rhomboid family serine protease